MSALLYAFLLLLAAGMVVKYPFIGIPVLILALVAHAVIRTIRRRIRSEGLSILVIRYHLGRAWHGEPLTDAGFRREGKRALTRTGHASRFAHRPQRERIAIRCGISLLVLAALYGLVFDRGVTLLAMEVGTVAAAAGGTWLAVRAARLRKHRKSRMFPVHNALTTIVRKGIPTKPESWLAIDRGTPVKWVEITLPDEFAADANQIKAITAAVVARTGMKNPEAKPKFTGAKPVLRLQAIEPPPKRLAFEDIRAAAEAARHDELVLGRAAGGALKTVSLAGDSPHLGLSVGSGGGKSVTAELLAAQAAYRGAIVLILDYPKLVSLPALRALPNVAYADSAALVHSACVWLAHELEERAQLVRQHTDFGGNYRGPYLPRLMVIAEESNALLNRLRRYWEDIRERGDPKRSPAIDGLELAFLMGRQLFINVVQIGQMLTTRAVGSGEARENMGIRIMGRATVNNWNVMVPEHPYPGKTKIPGRMHVVTDDCVETQIAWIPHKEARLLAVSGTVTPCPPRMPGRPRVLGGEQHPEIPVAESPDQGIVLEPEPPVLDPVPDAVTLRQAVEMALVACSLPALQRASTRPGFAQAVGKRGLAKTYRPEDLVAHGKGLR